MISIDIDKIMNEIREEIKEKGYVEDLPSYKESCDFFSNEAEELLNESYDTQNYAYVEEYPVWKVGGVTGNIKIFVKKIIRKAIKFYVVPIVEKQNVYNRLVGNSCVNISKCLLDQKNEIDGMRKKIRELENKCLDLEKRIDEKGK